MSEPRLSFVAASRNDNHGGDLTRRMQLFVAALREQCARHELPAELVLVEWNPPADRPPLAEALRWGGDGPCDVRIVTVPRELHAKLPHSEHLPLYQMIAKNVGIRRARAPFVVATNIDILLSDALMRVLRGALRPDRMLRVDRVDVAADVPDAPVAEQLAWCAGHVIRLNQRDQTLDLRTGERHGVHWPWTSRLRLLEALQDVRLIPAVTRKRLHINACGDFTLLHQDAWAALRGYAEWPIYSMHLDSLLCHAAHFAGYREQWVDAPVYHIEHAAGSGWSPEGEAKLNARLAAAGIPQLALHEFQRHAVKMRQDCAPLITGDAGWGLVDADLTETYPLRRHARGVAA